jgi:peptide/nickel transport system substrate-binding protein
MPRTCRRLFIVFTVLWALAGCSTAPPPRDEPTIIRGLFHADVVTLSPVGKSHRLSLVLGRQITDSLVQYDRNLNEKPRLAESWEFSSDGRTLTFHLREGVRWHDGKPFTSEDVLLTVRKARDPATEARSAMSQFESLTSLTAPDAQTVVATYAEPFVDALESWTIPILPAHLIDPDEPLLTSSFAEHPIGCGPFRLVEAVPGRSILLEANDDYWDGRPLIDKLEFLIIPDERTAYQALLTGDLDLMAVTPDIWKVYRNSQDSRHLKQFTFARNNMWYTAWNQNGDRPFQDPRTRQAMIHALDRATFITQILDGRARQGITSYHPDSAWADPALTPREFDQERAMRYLAEAGWEDRDGDGILDKGGRPFRFTLLYPRGSQEITPRMAAWMQQSWAQIGIDAELEALEWRAFLEKRNSGNYDAVMANMSFSGGSPDQRELYHSEARENGFNFFGLEDPEIDRLLDEGRSTADRGKRIAIYRRLQARLYELEPLGVVFHFQVPVLLQADIEGVEPSPLGLWRHWPGPRAWSRSGGS